jgi:hypothetical protein
VPSSVNRGTSLTIKRTLLGPYRRPMPRVPGGSKEHFLLVARHRRRDVHLRAITFLLARQFLMSEAIHFGLLG